MTMNNGVARLEWAFSVAPVISRLPLLPGRTVAHAYSVLFLNFERGKKVRTPVHAAKAVF